MCRLPSLFPEVYPPRLSSQSCHDNTTHLSFTWGVVRPNAVCRHNHITGHYLMVIKNSKGKTTKSSRFYGSRKERNTTDVRGKSRSTEGKIRSTDGNLKT